MSLLDGIQQVSTGVRMAAGAPRVDANEKVRGLARYGADDARRNMAYAALAVATVPRGRITSLDTAAAERVPGVRLVLTNENLGRIRPAGFAGEEGYAASSLQPLTTDRIAFRGQPIACVVADTFEAATEAAALVRAEYDVRRFAVTLDADGAERLVQAEAPLEIPGPKAGSASRALARAAARVDQIYECAANHNNPMELISTVAEWRDGQLVVREGTQNAGGVKHGLAQQLRISPDRVRVISTYLGGSFGQRNFLLGQTVLAAIAARRLRRPVKLVMTRQQIFNTVSFRPTFRSRVRLGADRGGKLMAAIHETESQTSRLDLFATSYTEVTARLYGIPDFTGLETLVQTDVQTPGYMRAPFDHTSAFSFESAVDELAVATGTDPVQMRLRSDARRDEITGKPLSSRHLNECLTRGARQFGWSRRDPEPRSMTASNGDLIGWGVAAGAYGSGIAPAIATLRATDDDDVTVSVGVHELGQGARNVVAGAVAEVLDIPVDAVTVEIGDTTGAPPHLTAGAWGTTTAVPAVRKASERLLGELRELDERAGRGRTPGQVLRAANRPFVSAQASTRAPGQPKREALGALRNGGFGVVGPEFEEFVSFSYIAHFVEVRVEPTTRRVRVPRVVTVVDCGRVLSPRTALSQVRGGVIWGIGAALREASEVDARHGGFVNADLAEYVIPCNADIGDLQADFIDKPDDVLTSTGVKNLGEVVMVGVAPAIANAIHHATGRRFRRLPIRLDDLFG